MKLEEKNQIKYSQCRFNYGKFFIGGAETLNEEQI
jgi:hypothetical protein